MTASTANSGNVCIQARMANANPWAIKNWADSAAHAIIKAETRIAGAVQSMVAGPVSRISDAKNSSKKAGVKLRKGNRPMVQRTYAILSRRNAAARVRRYRGARMSGAHS